MKKYKKFTEKASSYILLILALCILGIIVAFLIIFGTENEAFVILISFFITIVCVFCTNKIETAYKYSYFDCYIGLYYLCVKYKKVKYSDYAYIVVSNASYNMGYGYASGSPAVDRPIQRVVNTSFGKKKITYPFISLHTKNFPIEKVKKGITSRELFFLKEDEICCLGICWFDSLLELLSHTCVNVYIVEDVYLRFKEDFDTTISQTSKGLERFYIVLDNPITYKEYRNKTQTQGGTQGD